MKKAFTLMEILIVLIIVGILTAIMIPSFKKFRENAELIKFLRAHQAFTTAISSIVNSDYYLDGDLGVKPNGDLIDGTHTGDYTYLCETMAQFLDAKKVNCVTATRVDGAVYGVWSTKWDDASNDFYGYIDGFCNGASADNIKNIKPNEGIILKDGTVIYETEPSDSFGAPCKPEYGCTTGNRKMIDRSRNPGEMVSIYKVMCIDINGLENNHGYPTCVGTCPFGYGVRYDGKIIPGRQATEWVNKANKHNVATY